MDHKYKIKSFLSFFFLLTIDFLKILIDLPNPNFKFIPFVYTMWEKCFFEGFCSCWKLPCNRVGDDLSKYFS